MHLSRCFSAVIVPLIAASVGFSTQVMGSSSGAVASMTGTQASNTPYTLDRTSTIVQTLADGTTITRAFTGKTARDSAGRTYNETHEILHIRADGQPVDVVNYSVVDPVAHTDANWNSRTKTAIVTHVLIPETIRRRTEPVTVPQSIPDKHRETTRPQATREDLGVRTIAGFETKGIRTSLVIPAGEQGNDRAITVVTEEWRSIEYGLPLLSIRDDPRTGKRTDEVTDFRPGEPDPALFKIPEGYTVRDQPD